LKPAERRSGTDDGADPSSVLLSMWNRGKRSVGLGLTNREIAELRYQGLYQVVDLSKNFFFSYTYDLVRTFCCVLLLPPNHLLNNFVVVKDSKFTRKFSSDHDQALSSAAVD
jgi:hypothetical protein